MSIYSTETPPKTWASAALVAAQKKLRPDIKKRWRWWRLPNPPNQLISLQDIIEDEPFDVTWHTFEETSRLLAMMSEVNIQKITSAQQSSNRTVGTIYRRTRVDAGGMKRQRAELRLDGKAGCLRTPGGGSSRQIIVVVEKNHVRTRLLSSREAARLMGISEAYKLPTKYNDAYHLIGDALAVPAVQFLSKNLLLPLVTADDTFKQAAE